MCLKFIKLRNTLQEILTTYDIYSKAEKYKEIYDTFIQLGFIVKSTEFSSIVQCNLFPNADVFFKSKLAFTAAGTEIRGYSNRRGYNWDSFREKQKEKDQAV